MNIVVRERLAERWFLMHHKLLALLNETKHKANISSVDIAKKIDVEVDDVDQTLAGKGSLRDMHNVAVGMGFRLDFTLVAIDRV